MQHTKSCIMIALGAVILFMSACSQSSSSDGPTEPTDTRYSLSEGTLTEATLPSVTGTWVETNSNDEGTIISIDTWTFDASGNFTHIIDLTMNFTGTPSHSWSGETGTASFADSAVTFTISAIGKSSTAAYDAATATADWTPITKIEKKNAVIIDGKLCVEVAKRVGTGSGIAGNWEKIYSTEYPGMPTNIDSYSKNTYVFTASGYSDEFITSGSPTFDTIDYTTDSAYTYTVGPDNTVKITSSGETITDTIRISGDWLNLGAGATKVS